MRSQVALSRPVVSLRVSENAEGPIGSPTYAETCAALDAALSCAASLTCILGPVWMTRRKWRLRLGCHAPGLLRSPLITMLGWRIPFGMRVLVGVREISFPLCGHLVSFHSVSWRLRRAVNLAASKRATPIICAPRYGPSNRLSGRNTTSG